MPPMRNQSRSAGQVPPMISSSPSIASANVPSTSIIQLSRKLQNQDTRDHIRMSGIFGWIAGVNTQPGYDTLVELTDSLAHRGPDGVGYELLKLGGGTHSLALGHRRLSIIDLSNSSAQPMWSADG